MSREPTAGGRAGGGSAPFSPRAAGRGWWAEGGGEGAGGGGAGWVGLPLLSGRGGWPGVAARPPGPPFPRPRGAGFERPGPREGEGAPPLGGEARRQEEAARRQAEEA